MNRNVVAGVIVGLLCYFMDTGIGWIRKQKTCKHNVLSNSDDFN